MHSHGELSVIVNPLASSKIYQGITTEVVGNCGSSLAPICNNKVEAKIKRRVRKYGVDLEWGSMGEYLSYVVDKGSAVNLVNLVGHGILRQAVIGSERRSASLVEIEKMQRLLEDSLKEGAFGLSTGLMYPPSSYATTEELIELAKVVKDYDGIYASHLRDEGDYLLEAVKEAIRIGRDSEVKVEISHHKVAGKNNWGKIEDSLELIRKAREEGIDVNCDFYPYLALSTDLSLLLPSQIFGGSIDRIKRRIRTNRKQLITYLNQERVKHDGWDKIIITETNKHKEYEGLAIVEIAIKENRSPAEVVLDLLLNDRLDVAMIQFAMAEDDLLKVLKSEFSMVGTDAISRVKDGLLDSSHCHPRTYGTFPKIINRYVKSGVLSLEEAIKKMTSLPAEKLGIKRGKIKEGYFADLVIFDLDKIKDRATYENPHQYSVGFEYIIINGKVILEDGKQLARLNGEVIRSG